MYKIEPSEEALHEIWDAIREETSKRAGIDSSELDGYDAATNAVALAAWNACKKHLEHVLAPLEERVSALEEIMKGGKFK